MDEDEGTGGAKKAVSKKARAKVVGPKAGGAKDQREAAVRNILDKADKKRDGTSKELYEMLDS